MSGPFGVNMTVISGQERSGELVLAAATFLAMGYLSIDCVCTDRSVREEFLTMLSVFSDRAKISYYDNPKKYVQKLIEPGSTISTKDLFWLALDREGEALAREIFAANGDPTNKRVYRSVRKLNLIEREIQPPPQTIIPLQTWEEARLRHSSRTFGDYIRNRERSSQSLGDENASPTSQEGEYIVWCTSLYEALLPWQALIKGIQSDFS